MNGNLHKFMKTPAKNWKLIIHFSVNYGAKTLKLVNHKMYKISTIKPAKSWLKYLLIKDFYNNGKDKDQEAEFLADHSVILIKGFYSFIVSFYCLW